MEVKVHPGFVFVYALQPAALFLLQIHQFLLVMYELLECYWFVCIAQPVNYNAWLSPM